MGELPQGVDSEILDDIRRVEQCHTIFEATHQQIEVWEVFCLVMLDREETQKTMKVLLEHQAAGKSDEFNQGALALFEQLLKMRAKFGKFVRELRQYIAILPVGHFGRATTEMALGFIVVSDRGRQRAAQWLAEPKAHEQDAAGRMEDLISRAMKYETALRASA